ncbi:MAG: RNA polymerase sigma factor [Segetibacter sp.]
METLTLATDNQLIKLFQNGNNEALETLVNRYKDKLFTSIVVLVKDQYLAEDLFQEVFFQITDTCRSNCYNEEAEFLPWATRIAYNLCVDHCRKEKQAPTITVSDNSDIPDLNSSIVSGSKSDVFEEQLQGELLDMCNLLPQDEREVIVLRHYGNLDFKEIVVMTKSNIDTVMGHMRNGLFFLKKMMEENK